MVLIGDYSWVLYAVFSVLGVLLPGYFIGMYAWSVFHRTRPAGKSIKREPGRALGSGREAMHTP